MLYRKTECAFGDYVDEAKRRYVLESALCIRPMAKEWVFFEREEECLAAWGLTPYSTNPLTDS